MDLSIAINLIEKGVTATRPSIWADLGAGSGLFTRALATILPRGSTVYAIDTNKSSLQKIKPVEGREIKTIIGDFEQTQSGDSLPMNLDGILMANSLHFINDKLSFLESVITHIKPPATFVIVEYNTDKPNQWVPYPISFELLKKLFTEIGYEVELIGEGKSLYNKQGIYALRAQPAD